MQCDLISYENDLMFLRGVTQTLLITPSDDLIKPWGEGYTYSSPSASPKLKKSYIISILLAFTAAFSFTDTNKSKWNLRT